MSRRSTAGTSDGMSPPTTSTTSASVAARPASTPASGPSKARASSTRRAPAGIGAVAPGATTTSTSSTTPATAPTARSSIGTPSTGSASLSRPKRDDRPPASTIAAVVIGSRPRRRAAARGPGRCPSGVRRRIPRRSRSSRIAMTYRRLVPVASRSAAGVSGAAVRERERLGRQRRVGAGGVGERRLEDDDPAVALERADPLGRAPGGAGRVGEGRRRDDGERRLEAIHGGGERRIRGGGRGARERDAVAGTDQAPVADQRVDDGAGGPDRIVPGERHGPADRAGRRGAQVGQAGPVADPRERGIGRQPPRHPDARRTPSASTTRAVELEPGRGGGGRVAGATAAASAATRAAVCRRRETPRAGTTSMTCPPTTWCAPDGRRSTNRSPGAAATGSASRRIAATSVPPGRSMASRPLRPTAASTAAVPRCRRARVRSGSGARRRTSIRSVATTAGIRGEDLPARERLGLDAGDVDRRPARTGRRRPTRCGPGARALARCASPGSTRSGRRRDPAARRGACPSPRRRGP